MANFLKPRFLESRREKGIQAPEVAKELTPETHTQTTPEHEVAHETEPSHAEARAETLSATSALVQHHGHVAPLTERVQTAHTKSERLVAIERVMSDGLGEIYASLSKEEQAQVKTSGEEAAHTIETLLEQGVFVAKKIVAILRDWLKKIPGVNAYFLEQESKIKTDRILAIAKKGRT